MDSAIHVRHVEIPRVALATGAVVVATIAAAVTAWTALPGAAADDPPVVSRPPAHARHMAGMNMAGMSMPGMKMPMRASATRR